MSHYIWVEAGGDELQSYLNISGDLSKFYQAIGAPHADQGICGDGNKVVTREMVEKVKQEMIGEVAITDFLQDVLDETDSDMFIFNFS